MVSAFTPNKHIEQPANGDYVDDWDVPVNADWAIIDEGFGGQTNLNATGASGTIVLTTSQYQPLIINISGTLTANVNYQIPSGIGGQWIVNNTTTGAFAITFSSGGGGLTVVVGQGLIEQIYSDGTNIQPSSTAASIANGSVTNAKLAVAPNLTIKSNIGGSSASPSDNTLSAILNATVGTGQGLLIFRGGSVWGGLPAGITGQFLQTGGVGGNPSWQTPPTFGASGGSHSAGYVPDPGSTAGTGRYLREDATWQPVVKAIGTVVPPTTVNSGGFNVASIVRNGLGNYTVTFTNPLPNTNYVVSLIASQFNSTPTLLSVFAKNTGSFVFICVDTINGSGIDITTAVDFTVLSSS